MSPDPVLHCSPPLYLKTKSVINWLPSVLPGCLHPIAISTHQSSINLPSVPSAVITTCHSRCPSFTHLLLLILSKYICSTCHLISSLLIASYFCHIILILFISKNFCKIAAMY